MPGPSPGGVRLPNGERLRVPPARLFTTTEDVHDLVRRAHIAGVPDIPLKVPPTPHTDVNARIADVEQLFRRIYIAEQERKMQEGRHRKIQEIQNALAMRDGPCDVEQMQRVVKLAAEADASFNDSIMRFWELHVAINDAVNAMIETAAAASPRGETVQVAMCVTKFVDDAMHQLRGYENVTEAGSAPSGPLGP